MYKFIHSVMTLLLVTLLAGCATEPEKTQIPAAHAPETTSIPEATNTSPIENISEEVTLEVLLTESSEGGQWERGDLICIRIPTQAKDGVLQ